MRRIFGILLLLVAGVLAVYVGGWLFFFKAIVDIIEAIKAGWIAIDIAWGLFKIFIGLPVVDFIAGIMAVLSFDIFLSD